MIYLWKAVIVHSYVYVNCQKVIRFFWGGVFSWICRDGMFIGRNMNDIIINPLRNINCQPSNPRSPSSVLDLLIFRERIWYWGDGQTRICLETVRHNVQIFWLKSDSSIENDELTYLSLKMCDLIFHHETWGGNSIINNWFIESNLHAWKKQKPGMKPPPRSTWWWLEWGGRAAFGI
jgi:hypothetical protein